MSTHVNYLQGKIQRNSLQGNTEVTPVHLAKKNQLLGWKKNNFMICLWGCSVSNMSVPAANANRKSKTPVRDQWPFSSTHCRRRAGDKLCHGWAGTGHTRDAELRLHSGTGDAAWAPSSLLSPSPPHPSLHAVVAQSNWEWRDCLDARATAPTQPSYCCWQTLIRREQHVFGLGATSPPLPALMTAQPLQSASSDHLIHH